MEDGIYAGNSQRELIFAFAIVMGLLGKYFEIELS